MVKANEILDFEGLLIMIKGFVIYHDSFYDDFLYLRILVIKNTTSEAMII